MTRREKHQENIYTSRYIQELENNYCTSRSAIVSQVGLSCGSATLATRIINGGKRALYTAAVAGMLVNNMAPYGYADLIVNAGQTSTGLTVGIDPSNDVVNILSNYGTTVGTVINSGGQEIIYNGGSATDAVIEANGVQNVSNGGSAIRVTNNGGTQNVSAGANTTSGEINSNGVQNVYGGAAYNTINSGIQNAYNGAILVDNTIKENGVQNLSSGALDVGVGNSGGIQNVYAGAEARSSWMGNNATQNVYGLANVVDFYSGTQNVYEGGIASKTLVLTANAVQNIYSGGSALATSAVNGGIQNVLDGAYASGTVVSQNGLQNVSGTVDNTSVGNGTQNIYNGGIANSTTVNGVQNVLSGGSALVVNLNVGTQNILSGGYVSGTTLTGNATQNVAGTASDTVISSGTQNISSGGVVYNTFVSTHGVQNVSAGASANATSMFIGSQNVLNGGYASGTVINYSGVQNVYGTAENASVNSGTQNIYDGGLVSNTTVNGYGTQNILSGGTANNVTNSGIVNLSAGGILNNYTAGINRGNLNIYGNNTISGTTNLRGGDLVFANDTPTTLSVENLSANNARISMGVNLENQTADQLVVQSSYNGNATLCLRNTGTVTNPTSDEGIKLIDIEEGVTGTGSFELLGGKWDQGGYVYNLDQSAVDNDYYLKSTGGYSDTFKTMANVPMLNAVVAKAGMNSLNKRMGELRDMNNPEAKQGVWARTYYKSMTVSDLLKTDMSLFGVEAGYDWLFNADEPNKIYAGVMLGYTNVNSIKTKTDAGDSNKGSGDAPSVGIYATLANEGGWFIDFAARNFWTKIENTTHTAADTLLKFDSDRSLFTVSVEGGKDYILDNGLKIEPKAELAYMKASGDTTNVVNGTGDLKYASETYLTGKAAVMFSYKTEMANQLLIEPLLELAYNQEFNGKGKVSYGGAETETSLKGGSFEVAAGLSMQLADNLYWHALGTYEAGSKIDGFGLNAGIRFAFGGGATAKKTSTKAKAVKTNKKQVQPKQSVYRYEYEDEEETPKVIKSKKVEKVKKTETVENSYRYTPPANKKQKKSKVKKVQKQEDMDIFERYQNML